MVFSKLKQIALAGIASAGIIACAEDTVELHPACVQDVIRIFKEDNPDTAVAPQCIIADAEKTKIENTLFQHPPEYKDELQKIFSFVYNEFSNKKDNLDGLKEVSFYNPLQEACKEAYGGNPLQLVFVRGFTNSTNFLFLNDMSNFINLDRDEQVERKAYFSFVINGNYHIFVHELGHVELERYFLTAANSRIDEITPQEDPCYGEKKHWLVERYAHFVQMAFARAYPEEFAENNFFEQNLFPYLENLLEENPEQLKEDLSKWRTFVDSWDEILASSLDANEDYHDVQYAFFKDEAKVISPEFPYGLSYQVIAPFLEELVAQQQEHAQQKLDALEELLP